MNISKKDLNLLLVFHVVYQEKNASKAATRLHMSQPGLSHQLQKLREEWQDPLFIKAARGLTPTPKAHEIALPVAQLVAQVEKFYTDLMSTELAQQEERVVVYTTDYMEQKLLPVLLPILQQYTPKVRIITKNTQGELPKEALENGTCDLAIAGFFENLPYSYYQQPLITESFRVLVREQHPAIQQGQLSFADYTFYPHIVTTLRGDLNSAIDSHLAALGAQRQVIAGVSSFLSTAALIRSGDWFLTCLDSLAETFCAQDPNLRSFPLPFSIPDIRIAQVWHARTHYDPLRKWIREQVKHILQA